MPEQPIETGQKKSLRELSHEQLGQLFDAKRAKESVAKEVSKDLRELAKQVEKKDVEQEMVQRLPSSWFEGFYNSRLNQGKTDVPKEQLQLIMDAWLSGVLTDFFRIKPPVSEEDLKGLRDKLPIIDEIKNGKFIAYGQEGKSHAIQFDSFNIEKRKTKNKPDEYVFVYGVQVKVEGSKALKQAVESTSINLGAAEHVQHRFQVELTAESDVKAGAIMRPAVSPEDKEKLGNAQGVILTERDKPFVILIQADLLQEGKKEELRKTIDHEIEHLVGMTHKPGEAEKEGEHATLLTTDRNTKNKKEKASDRPEKEFQTISLQEALDRNFTVAAFNAKKEAWETKYGIEVGFTENQLGTIKAAVIEIAKQRDIDLSTKIPEKEESGVTGLIDKMKSAASGGLDVKKLQEEMDAKIGALLAYLGDLKSKITTHQEKFSKNGKLSWEFLLRSDSLREYLSDKSKLVELLKADASGLKAKLGDVQQQLVGIYNVELSRINQEALAVTAKELGSKDTEIKRATSLAEITALTKEKSAPEAGKEPKKEGVDLETVLKNGIPLNEVKAVANITKDNYQQEIGKMLQEKLKDSLPADLKPENKDKIVQLFFQKMQQEKKILFPPFKEGANSFLIEKKDNGTYEVRLDTRENLVPQIDISASGTESTSGNILEKGKAFFQNMIESLKKAGGWFGGIVAGILGGLSFIFDMEYWKTYVQGMLGDEKAKQRAEKIKEAHNYASALHTGVATYLQENAKKDATLENVQKALPPSFDSKFVQTLLNDTTLKNDLWAIEGAEQEPKAEDKKEEKKTKPTPVFSPEKLAPLLFGDPACLEYFAFVTLPENQKILGDSKKTEGKTKELLSKDNFEAHALKALAFRKEKLGSSNPAGATLLAFLGISGELPEGKSDREAKAAKEKTEKEKEVQQKKKESVDQAWKMLKGPNQKIENVVLADDVVAKIEVPEGSDKKPDYSKVQEKLKDLLVGGLGGIEGVKKWCEFLAERKETNLKAAHLDMLKTLKENFPPTNAGTLDFAKIYKSYNDQNEATSSNPFPKSPDEFVKAVTEYPLKDADKLKQALNQNSWPINTPAKT